MKALLLSLTYFRFIASKPSTIGSRKRVESEGLNDTLKTVGFA